MFPDTKVFCLLFYKKKGWFFPQRKSRKTNLDLLYSLTQKFFAYFFTEKGSHLQYSSRTTNLDITKPLTQKFFAYFFTKKYGFTKK